MAGLPGEADTGAAGGVIENPKRLSPPNDAIDPKDSPTHTSSLRYPPDAAGRPHEAHKAPAAPHLPEKL